MLQDRLAQLLLDAATEDKKGFVTAGYDFDFIFQGRAFSFNALFDVATTPNTFILLDPTSVDYLIAFPFSFKAEDGPFIVSLYVGTDYTGGTPVFTYNRNSLSSNTTSAVITSGASGSSKGTMISQFLIGTGGGPLSSAGGEGGDKLPFIANTDYKYLLELDNQSATNPALMQIDFTWFE